jgi:hypothetical protein
VRRGRPLYNIIQTLQLQPAAQEAARRAQPDFVGMSLAIADRAAYADLIAAQVKVRACACVHRNCACERLHLHGRFLLLYMLLHTCRRVMAVSWCV